MAQDKLCLSPFLSLFLSLSLTRGRPPPLPTCLFRGAVDEGEVPGGAGRHCFSSDQAFSRSSKKTLKPGLVVQGKHGWDVGGHRRGLSRCPPLARYFKSYTLKICLSLSLSLPLSLGFRRPRKRAHLQPIAYLRILKYISGHIWRGTLVAAKCPTGVPRS